MRLDHLCSVGPPYFVNQVVQPHASGPTEHKWSKRTQVVQAEERRREPTEPFSPGVVVRDRGQRGTVRTGAVRGGGGGSVLCSSRCAFRPRGVHFALERALLTAPLEGKMHRSSAKCTPRHPGIGAGPARGAGVIAEAAVRAGARGGAGCPNLLQRPGSRLSAGGESLIFRASARRRSRRGTPLQQIRTRPRPEPPQAPHPHHPAPARPRHRADPGRSGDLPGEKGPPNNLP